MKSKPKTKKQLNPYDKDGNWVEEKNRIKGAIRRTFRLSPQFKAIIVEARVELPPALKKNGKPGKKNQVRFKCARCGELFQSKFINVDHIEPVVPLHTNEAEMSYDALVRGVFCKIENLQILCSTPLKFNNGFPSCHSIKTNEENFIRSKIGGLSEGSSYDLNAIRQEFEVHLAEKIKLAEEKAERKRLKELKRKTK